MSGIVENRLFFLIIHSDYAAGIEKEGAFEIATKFGLLLKLHSSFGLHQYTATLLKSGLFN